MLSWLLGFQKKPKESKTKRLSSDPNDICHRIKLLLQGMGAGYNSNKINKKIVAMVDQIVEYQCISTKQHSSLLELFL